MNIIQISYYFYKDSLDSSWWLIPISLIIAFFDCWSGLIAWYDFNLIKNKINYNLIENVYDLIERD
jgi:hypothetical protein